jgi:MFS family permease
VRRGLLRVAPAFRSLWLSRAISFTGDGVARVALVLLVAPRGPTDVSVVLLANTLPRLLGPVAGAVADRVDQRRLLVVCELGQGAIYAVLALTAPSLTVLLVLVAVAGVLATLFTPAGKSSIPRLVDADRYAEANALLGAAFNLQIVAGPALGGVLVGFAGTSWAFGVNAASFGMSALLLARLPRLLPEPGGAAAGLLAETRAGLRYTMTTRAPRALALGTLVFVSFAAIDNVALVFLVRRVLHGSQSEYGVAVASFGFGMLAASVVLARLAARWPPQRWLFGGVVCGAVGTAGTGLAPSLGLAVVGQAVAGVGNTADLVGTDTLVQQLVPHRMLGRVFGTVGTAAQVGSGIAYAGGGPLVASLGARWALIVSAIGMLVGLAALTPVFRMRVPPVPVEPTRLGELT